MRMKKSAALAAALLVCASSAYAYENSYAGYSIKDGDPYVRVETNKVYGYSLAQSTDIAKMLKEEEKNSKAKVPKANVLAKYCGANAVNYYTAAEMKEIIGEDFSTSYFDAEYEKLALLERSQLNLKTVPTPLLDMEKYNAFENKGNLVMQNQVLKEKITELTPTIHLEKIAGKKVITLKYLYKQMNNLFNIDVSLMSANDRLYILTNFNTDMELYAPKTDTKSNEKPDAEAKNALKKAMQEATNIENVNATAVPAANMSKFTKQHTKLLKSISFYEPAKAAQPLTFTDTTMGKKITLPDDWYYSQIKYQIGAKTNATITTAGSVPELRNAVNAMDINGMFNTIADNIDNTDKEASVADTAAFGKIAAKYKEEYTKALRYINSGFVTTSFKVEDNDLKQMLESPISNQIMANVMLRDGLKRLKSFNSENFTLKDYKYKLDFTREKANINIAADFMALKEFDFNSKLFLGCKGDIASMMFFVKKAGFEPETALVEQIDTWQF